MVGTRCIQDLSQVTLEMHTLITQMSGVLAGHGVILNKLQNDIAEMKPKQKKKEKGKGS